MNFLQSFTSEWLKTKRSASFWLTVVGGLFIPTIYLIGFLYMGKSINSSEGPINIWIQHFNQSWQNMAFFLLPMGVILVTSLITQMEYKNNTWKQVHTTPQTYITLFLAKLSVILVLVFQFFVFFTIGLILSAIIPTLIFDGNLGNQSFPVYKIGVGTLKFFIACLPIVAIQYLLSLRFKNFIVPIGIGLCFLIGSLIGNSWEHIYLSPYSFGFLNVSPLLKLSCSWDLRIIATISFTLISVVNFFMYFNKKEKG
jgi:hypothetical protein